VTARYAKGVPRKVTGTSEVREEMWWVRQGYAKGTPAKPRQLRQVREGYAIGTRNGQEGTRGTRVYRTRTSCTCHAAPEVGN